jgi:type III secretion protein D
MSDWILKILSGPHRGAEIALAAGDYQVGSDEADDLVLHGCQLQKAHFRLHIGATSLAITLLIDAMPLVVDGEAQTATAVAIPSLSLIGLGGLLFALGRPEDDWSQPALQPSPAVGDGQIGDKAVDSATETAQPPAVGKKRSHRKVGAVTLLGSVGAALVFLTLFLRSGEPLATVPPAAPTVPMPQEQWREIGEKVDTSQLELVVTEQGHAIKGYVGTQADFDKLHSLIEMVGLQAHEEIVVIEKIIGAAQDILQDQGLNDIGVFQGAERDVFVLEGVVPDEKKWQAVFAILERDVKGVGRWQIKITFTQPNKEPAPSFSLGFSIRSIHVSRTPFIVADSGEKFSEGSRLESGYMIEKITTDFVNVERDGKKIAIPTHEK